MSAIADVGWQIVAGLRPAPNTGYGACQSNGRRVADAGLGFTTYAKYPVPKDPRYGDITAATAETAWRAAGLSVPTPLPGDLVYAPGDSPAGHMGVYLGLRDGVPYVLENTWTNRGTVVGGQQYIRLTPLSKFGPVRTVIRFPEDRKTEEDQRQGTGVPATAPPDAATAPTPAPGPLGALGLSQGQSGLVGAMPEAQNFRDDPAWLFHTLPAYQDRAPVAVDTNLGQVRSIVILRQPTADEMEFAVPFLGPLSVDVKNSAAQLRKHWDQLKTYYGRTESWGRYYAPLYDMALSQDPGVHRYPIPDVTGIQVRQEAGGNAVAEVELQIQEAEHAEMVLSTLTMAARYKNAFIEVWLPTAYYDASKKEGERAILYPAFVGLPEEVSSSPWPHSIRFRVVPQDHLINLRGVNPSDAGVPNSWPAETPLWKIIEDLGKAYKISFVTPSGLDLADLKQLQGEIKGEYNALYRPPLDVVRDIVERTAGLRLTRISGLELLGKSVVPGGTRAIWMIYDPLAYHPFTTGFWKNQLWTKVMKPVAGLLTGNSDLVGEISVFYPVGLGRDVKYIKKMAAQLDTYGTDEAREAPLRRLVDRLSSVMSFFGVGDGTAVKSAYEGEFKTTLIEYINAWYATSDEERTPTQKWLMPTLAVEEFVTRTPSEAELANPVFGTPHGQGGQRGSATTAEKAARLMQIGQAPDGGFFIQTPNGPQQFDRKDAVYLYYAANTARPSMVVPVNPRAEVDDAQGKFFPYTVRLRVKPTHGCRVGQVAVLIGFGRLDGHWEVQGTDMTLTGSEQELIVTLRTARDLYLV